ARYRALVYASLVASFLVVVWGGIVRVTGSGLGCPDWPLCHGQFLPSLDPATRIEWFHRFLAIAGGVTVAAVVLWSLIVYRADRRILTLAIIAAILYPLQAVLGAITVVLELPPEWVTVHLANAELLLAALTILAVIVRWPRIAREHAPGWTWLAVAAAVLFVVHVALGAANPLSGFSPWALGAHPAVASLLWCSVIGLAAVAWRPASQQGALVRDLIALTKPAIMSLLLLTALG